MIYWVALFLVLVMAGSFWLVRKYVLGWMQDVPNAGSGFTLSELRDLHRKGAMSQEEFDRAKNLLLQTMQVPKKPPESAPAPSQNRPDP